MSNHESWVVSNPGEYPYVAQEFPLRRIKDHYKRNVSSLLKSIGSFTKKTCNPKNVNNFLPVQVNDTRYMADDFRRISRVCTKEMTPPDYEHFFFPETQRGCTRKGSLVRHVHLFQKQETALFEELPDLRFYRDIILSTSTFSATGNVLLFLVSTSQSTIDIHCTAPIPFPEVKMNATKVVWILSKPFLDNFLSCFDYRCKRIVTKTLSSWACILYGSYIDMGNTF
jgi:hypothetical protein